MERILARATALALCVATAGCDWTTTTARDSMRPAQLVDFAVPVAYVDPATGTVSDDASVRAARTGDAFQTAFSHRAIPVMTMTDVSIAESSPARRDFVQDALLQRSDVLCEHFVDGMYIRVTERKFLLGETALIASAVGAFSGGAAAEALSLVSTIAQGTDKLADTTILQNQLVTLIAAKIRSNRQQIVEEIMKRRVKNGLPTSLAAYPVSLALRDAQAYHQQCSFMSGLTNLTEQANKPNASATAPSAPAKKEGSN
jgi:hypothetical protein